MKFWNAHTEKAHGERQNHGVDGLRRRGRTIILLDVAKKKNCGNSSTMLRKVLLTLSISRDMVRVVERSPPALVDQNGKDSTLPATTVPNVQRRSCAPSELLGARL